MTEALAIIEQPRIRPKGVTPRQWRLAAIYPRAESAYQALRLAGYAHSTATQNAKSQLETVGVKLAMEVQGRQQRDSARGLVGMANKALTQGAAKMDELDTQEKLGFGLKAMELAHALGEHVTETGDGDRHRYRMRRAIALAYHFGCVATRRAQDVVLSPTHNSTVVAKERNE